MRKFLPYIIILIALVGLFGPMGDVEAQGVQVTCPPGKVQTGAGLCEDPNKPDEPATAGTVGTPPAKSTASTGESEFEKEINKFSCRFGITSIDIFPGCGVKFWYYVIYMPATFLLWIAALFLNAIIDLTINGSLLRTLFLSEAWGVVRDLSNIFFILILLYIAIKIILGLGASEVKKMIARVIIMALLINFSMFFTKVVIDTSNILALVFYSKLQPTTKEGTAAAVNPDGKSGAKDISGTMYGFFDPTKVMQEEFFTAFDTMSVPIGNSTVKVTEKGFLHAGIMIGIMIFAVIFIGFAIYCFTWAGIAFLGRIIELFILIVFSPFAFMSSTVPILAHAEYIGWDAWFKRLISVSFMAPVFMFFMYFIFMLIKKNPFSGLITGGSVIQIILNVAVPGLVILILLLKATSFAKKGSGVLGEKLMQGAKMVGGLVGGLALGAATGGAAIAGRASIGRLGAAAAGSGWAKNWEASHFGGEAVMAGLKKVGGASFDIRGAKIGGKTLASATGLNLGEAQKGGFIERREKDVRKRQERAREIEVGEDEHLKQNLNAAERDLQERLNANANDLRLFDTAIKNAREELDDAHKSGDANRITAASTALETAKTNKRDLKNRAGITNLERNVIPQAKQDIEDENRRRKWNYAEKLESATNRALNFILSGGQYALRRGSNEAAHKIRMEMKLDSGEKH